MVSYRGGALDAKLSPLFARLVHVLALGRGRGSGADWKWMTDQAAKNGHWQLLEKLSLTSRQMHQLFEIEYL